MWYSQTVMRNYSVNERIKQPEKLPAKQRASRFVARLGLAAACIIPVADLATSDAVTAKEYEIIQEPIMRLPRYICLFKFGGVPFIVSLSTIVLVPSAFT